MTDPRRRWQWLWLFFLATAVAACSNGGGKGGGSNPTATATIGSATATPTLAAATATPTATTQASAALSGLAVLQRQVDAGADDALAAPPAEFAGDKDAALFDRALSHADWILAGAIARRGSTGPDGRFEIPGLPPGRYTLELTKVLNGNLLGVTVPLVVGDDGAGQIVIEIAQGLVRTTLTYPDGNDTVTEIFGPDGSHVTKRNGIVVEINDLDPIAITALEVRGPAQVVVGRQGSLRASAVLEGGGEIDVTHLVDWLSSNEDVATVDRWGTVMTHALGTTNVTAVLGDIASIGFELEVVDRPSLNRLIVQNACYFVPGIAGPVVGAPTEPFPGDAALPPDLLPPTCRQVVRIGGALQFFAFGEFEDGSFEDLTREVSWEVVPAGVGEIDANGVFTGTQEGAARVRASLGTVVSELSDEVRVVAEATIVALSIHALNAPLPFFPGGPLFDAPFPCFDCGYSLTVLLGDTLEFHATAQYDTGEWEDVTDRVTWRSSNTTAAPIDAAGMMTAAAAGEVSIDATLDEVTSQPIDVNVVEEATLLFLSIYQEGQDRVVGKGEQAFFSAHGNYDIGFSRDLTDEATWHSSDEGVGGFDRPGVFTGRSAGDVEVWAALDGVESNHLPMEVFETSGIDYCDSNNVNRGEWSDAYNRVILESDCAVYTPPDVVQLRFTVTERERPRGIFDPCLDLFVYSDGQRIRTIREEGCGEPFLAPGAPEFDAAAPRYQLLAFWDLKDDQGNVVAPGTYTVFGRFYLYFDPVVSIDVAVTAPDGRLPCHDNPCGNGCGYVRACGDTDPPLICPLVCTPLCECPLGWGITAGGGCEPCADECCPPGALCPPNVPACLPPKECCGPTESCDPALPPCEVECCPPNGRCLPGTPPCEPAECCPLGAICILPLPPCEPGNCCPTGEECPDGLAPCELTCCPPNARCLPHVPPCDPAQCCPSGVSCPPDLLPCPSDIVEAHGHCFTAAGTCTGTFHATTRDACCAIEQLSAKPTKTSWCPAELLAQTGACLACAEPVCDGTVH